MTEGDDRKVNLVGLAAVLTAVAALLTAFGFPDFLPDLVKHRFLTPPSQSSALNQEPANLSPSSGAAIPSPGIVDSSLIAKTSPIEAALDLRQGMDYWEARNIILSAGWQPAQPDNLEGESGNVDFETSQISSALGQNLPEIISCQGTGLGLCEGMFQLEGGRSLQLIVSGNGLDSSPSLLFFESSFYIEPTEATLGVVEQLKPGLEYRKVEQLLISEGWQTDISNPMHRQDELPENSQRFLEEFSHFEDCAWDDYGDIYECLFILSTVGGRKLTIVTDVKGDRAYYEPTLKSWTLDIGQ